MLFPRFEEFSDPDRFNQSVAGFLDHIMKQNFAAFVDFASRETGHPVIEVERVVDTEQLTPRDAPLLQAIDTLIVISFDALRTGQQASAGEIEAVRTFLAKPGNVALICPHHDIGESSGLDHDAQLHRQEADFLHHGDRTIPPQQRFGGFARTLLAGLGAPIENRFGLHPASEPDGSPTPILVDRPLDRLHLLDGVKTFNLHPHLPHMERLGDATARFDVLARQKINLNAPPHPFTRDGRDNFDALLQSRPNVFAGALLVGDATLWSSTAGGIESLRQLWANVVNRAAIA
jgi:hypothetical protein